MGDIIICSLQRDNNPTVRYVICPLCGDPSSLVKSKVAKTFVWNCCLCDAHYVINLENCEPICVSENEHHINKILRHLINSHTMVYKIGVIKCQSLHVIGISTHECYTNEISSVSPVVKHIIDLFGADVSNIIGNYCKPNDNDIWKFIEPVSCLPTGDIDDIMRWHVRKYRRQKYFSTVYGIKKSINFHDKIPQIFMKIDSHNLAIIPNIRKHLENKYWVYVKYIDSCGLERVMMV